MYDTLTCPKCGFNPTEQNDSEMFESEHWNVSYENEYIPSTDEYVSWEEIRCPICNTVAYRND